MPFNLLALLWTLGVSSELEITASTNLRVCGFAMNCMDDCRQTVFLLSPLCNNRHFYLFHKKVYVNH